ncbi:hypothetical protein [Neobacillus sp. FSL H8-0543]|uniref:hypothetical protein n=1 Tax=Neobacillus sp. FSL H8-0543 TaxID=2954672 RepID=UPI003158295F
MNTKLLGFILILTISLFGCGQQVENKVEPQSTEPEVNQLELKPLTHTEIKSDMEEFLLYYEKLQSLLNYAATTQRPYYYEQAALEDYQKVLDLYGKYEKLSQLETENQAIAKFKGILEDYIDGLDLIIESKTMNEPLFIFDGYEKHILFKDDLEALTELLNISYTIGYKTATDESYSPLEEIELKNKLESLFGSEIIINGTPYQKFDFVHQFDYKDEHMASLSVISYNIDSTYSDNEIPMEDYSIHEEMQGILNAVFSHEEIDSAILTFNLDYRGKIMPAYIVYMKKSDFQSLDFNVNSFDFIVDFFGWDYSNYNQKYSLTFEEDSTSDDSDEEMKLVKEPIIKEDSNEPSALEKQFEELRLSIVDVFGKMEGEKWHELIYDEKVSLISQWIANFEKRGGQILKDPDWFVSMLDKNLREKPLIGPGGVVEHEYIGDILINSPYNPEVMILPSME